MRGPASLVSADGELQRAPTQNENLHIPAPSDLGVTWLEAWKHYIGLQTGHPGSGRSRSFAAPEGTCGVRGVHEWFVHNGLGGSGRPLTGHAGHAERHMGYKCLRGYGAMTSSVQPGTQLGYDLCPRECDPTPFTQKG